jgi:branched-chain amino acid transport system substrate-binding protein
MSKVARPRATTYRTRRALAGVAAASVLIASGCGLSAPSDTEETTDEPIQIGMSLPLSGPAADRAKPGMEGYQYWADEVNANGGLLGRQVELTVLDDGFDQQTAISDYNRLISQDQVDLLLGTFSSDLNLAVAPVAERYGYVYIQPSGGADEIFARDFNYLFFAQPTTTQGLPNQFVELIEQMPEEDRPETVALVQQDDPNTTQAAEIFGERLGELGVETVYNQTYAPDTSNFDTIANAIRQADPDVIVHGPVTSDGVSLVRSLQRVGFSPDMLYQQNAPTSPNYAEAIGEANTEGIFTSIAYSTETDFGGNPDFVAGYTEEYGYAPDEDAANSYTAGQVLQAAVEGAGNLDQAEMADWLLANTVDTIVGPLSWDAAGRSQGELLLAQFQSGELEVVAPADAATAEPLYSKPSWQ